MLTLPGARAVTLVFIQRTILSPGRVLSMTNLSRTPPGPTREVEVGPRLVTTAL